jgi:arylsulfatase
LKAYELRPNPKYASTLASYIREKKDPERAQLTSNTYYDWLLDRAYLLVPAQAYVGKFLGTFKEYPPRQKAATFSLDKVMEELQSAGGSK